MKTGQERDTEEVFEKLERGLQEVLPQATVERRWMGQVVETDDGMPFIGENEERRSSSPPGSAAMVLRSGTLSALMARDRFLGRANPWFSLLAVNRSPFHGGSLALRARERRLPVLFRPRSPAPGRGRLHWTQVGLEQGKIVSIRARKSRRIATERAN